MVEILKNINIILQFNMLVFDFKILLYFSENSKITIKTDFCGYILQNRVILFLNILAVLYLLSDLI